MLKKQPYIHLGCGDTRIIGAINVDARSTSATDIRYNCTSLEIFPSNHFEGVFSNAFWEHVFLNNRLHVIEECQRVLKENGFALFLGIPDFERVAKAYLNKEPGITTKIFDLSQVYRFTHGGPESTPSWWFENLHKSLFDVYTINEILLTAQFSSWIIFRYSYGEERVPGQLGFLAYKNSSEDVESMHKKLILLIDEFNIKYVNISSLEIVSINN
ncbi:MAG: methyltransferase domain-containing protein [Ignavibacteriaceae bacterium]